MKARLISVGRVKVESAQFRPKVLHEYIKTDVVDNYTTVTTSLVNAFELLYTKGMGKK